MTTWHDLIPSLEYNPEISTPALAKTLRLRSATLFHRISRLKQAGVLRLAAVVNPIALGFTPVVMFFSVKTSPKSSLQKMLASITAHPRTLWFGALAGEFQYGVTLLCRSYEDQRQLLYEIGREFEPFLTSKLIAPRLRITMLNRAYLAPAKQGRRQSLEMCRSVEPQKIDQLDHKILVRLVNGPFESQRGLARDLSEPFSTVERRVRRLRESGVIAGLLYSVDPDKLGIISYRLLIVTESINQSLESKLKSFALQNPHVIRFIQALGTFDFEFDVELRTAQQLPSLLQSLQAVGEGQIRDIHVMQELEDYKLSSYPLLAPP